ncbi:MAG: bifunctional diaminohydroxyphosphoribosylaminopyrimidine deaminase/5-amino-6-(5-phosphoribosylamino)uracil reductase RibD [Bacteroidota bacterium]
MKRAIALAMKGTGWVNPNPLVGAVLVSDGRIIGEGFHEFYGGPHAEVNAIGAVNEINAGLIAGSTLYVTLEPCSHYGKTPPCVDLIIEKKIGTVVIGMADPNPMVNGKGIVRLKENGITVEVGMLQPEIRRMNEVFNKFILTGLPFVVMKTAMTLDGKIATVTNASKWITGEASRKVVHQLRQRLSSIMVGVDTIISDDPTLNIRLKGEWKNPLKVITDTRLKIPMKAKILTNDPQLTLIATTNLADKKKLKEIERLGAQALVCPVKDDKVDLQFLMKSLGTMGIDSVLLEGGSTLAFSAMKEGIVDKIISFIAPKIIGGAHAPSPVGGAGIENIEDAIALIGMKIKKVGNDLMIEAMVEKNNRIIE